MERRKASDRHIDRRSFLNDAARVGAAALTVGAIPEIVRPTSVWALQAPKMTHAASARVLDRLRTSFTFQISVDVATLEQGLAVAGAALAGGVTIVERGGFDELALRGRRRRTHGRRVHQYGQGRGVRPLELQHFGRLGLEPEIKRQLPSARGEQTAHDRAEAGAAREIGVGLPDHRDIGEGVGQFTVYAAGGVNQTPLLHIAQVIVS